MKKATLLVLGLALSSLAFTQKTGADTSRWSYHMQVGTMASFSGSYGSGLSAFVSPSVSWQPSKRFRINAGFSLVNTTLFDYKPWYYNGFETGNAWNGNYTHALLYAEGQYLITKDLVLSGGIYADVPLTASDPSNPLTKSSFKGASMDLMYRIGPNSTIRAGFSYSRSEGPWYADPFRTAGPLFGDPFRSSETLFYDPFLNR